MSAILTVVAIILAVGCFVIIVWGDLRKRFGRKDD